MLGLLDISSLIFLALTFTSFYLGGGSNHFAIVFIAICFLLILSTFAFIFRKVIIKPLNLIMTTLEDDHSDTAIKQLKESSLEFSHIGDLFLNNKHQKDELQKAKEKAEESELLKASF